MESEQTINRQRRVFITALGNPRMLHARLPGGIIDRSQHIGWLYPSFPFSTGEDVTCTILVSIYCNHRAVIRVQPARRTRTTA